MCTTNTHNYPYNPIYTVFEKKSKKLLDKRKKNQYNVFKLIENESTLKENRL